MDAPEQNGFETEILKPENVDPQREKRSFRIMVAGESGFGKSSAISSLFELHKAPNFQKNKVSISGITVNISEKTYLLKVGNFDIHLTAIDTPGYGNSLILQESFNVVLSRIHRAFVNYKNNDMKKVEDNDLVDICFYFLSTPRIKIVDIEFIKQLKEWVTVIPVISKADTLTPDELEEYRTIVKEGLKDIIPTNNIFAIVGTSNIRDYGWGIVDPWNSNKETYDNIKFRQHIANCFPTIKGESVEKYKVWKEKGYPNLIKTTEKSTYLLETKGVLFLSFIMFIIAIIYYKLLK